MIELFSRTVRIGGNGCGYRDITIHEMTESEIRNLKDMRWITLIVGVVIGSVGMTIYDYRVFTDVFHKFCHVL